MSPDKRRVECPDYHDCKNYSPSCRRNVHFADAWRLRFNLRGKSRYASSQLKQGTRNVCGHAARRRDPP